MPAAERSKRDERVLRDFGRRVSAARAERGITQMDLAHKAGLHPTYIGQIENGRRNVALLNVYALAKALGVDPADLTSDRKAKPSAYGRSA